MTIQGVQVHWIDEGAGPPVLFVHGNPESGEMWRGVIRRLKGRTGAWLPTCPASAAPSRPNTSTARWRTWPASRTSRWTRSARANRCTWWCTISADRTAWLGPCAVRTNTVFFADYRWHAWARVWRTRVLGELSMALVSRPGLAWEMRRGSRKLTDEHIRETSALLTPSMKRMVLWLYRATNPESFAGWQEGLLGLTARIPTCVLWEIGRASCRERV